MCRIDRQCNHRGHVFGKDRRDDAAFINQTCAHDAQVTAPQEVTEAVYSNAVSVLPAYARGCAAELRGISERAASWAEPPPHMDDVAQPTSPPPASAQLEARLADPLLCRCLKVTCLSALHQA